MVSKARNVQLGVFSGGGCHHPNCYLNMTTLPDKDQNFAAFLRIEAKATLILKTRQFYSLGVPYLSYHLNMMYVF